MAPTRLMVSKQLWVKKRVTATLNDEAAKDSGSGDKVTCFYSDKPFFRQPCRNRATLALTKLPSVAMSRDFDPRHAAEKLKPIEVLDVPLWSEAEAQA